MDLEVGDTIEIDDVVWTVGRITESPYKTRLVARLDRKFEPSKVIVFRKMH